jgi:peptidoglycan/LPS O-acetylase OafA/YrhL
MSPTTSPVRYTSLDGLRGLVALTIVVHHFTQHSAGHHEMFASASSAVELFFCLSGFVIAHSYDERLRAGMPFLTYCKKRLLRLYPMYVVGLLLGVFAIWLQARHGLSDYTATGAAEAAVLNLFYLPFFGNQHYQLFVDTMPGILFPFNGPAWSLFFAIGANFVYAATIRLGKAMPFAIALIAGVTLYFVTAAHGGALGWGVENYYGGFPRVFFSFFSGVVIFQLRDRLTFVRSVPPLLLAVLVVGLVAVPRFPGHKAYWFANAVVIMPWIVVLGTRARRIESPRWQAICRYSANISYPIYCTHYPLLMIVAIYTGTNDHLVLRTLGFVLAAMVLAHVSWRHVETPLRAWLGRSVLRMAPAT